MQAVREMDYTINGVARSLQTRKTQTIGTLIPDIANPFFAEVARGVESVCKERNYSLLIGNTSEQSEEQARYLMAFRSRQVDGMLVFPAAGDEGALTPILEKRIPLVFVGRRPVSVTGDMVYVDNLLGTKLGICHLIEHGHRDIALITGPGLLTLASDRAGGYREALQSAGIPVREELIQSCDWDAGAATEVSRKLLAMSPRPTAVFTGNLILMTGLLRAAREAGLRVHEDLEVMTSDDHPWLDAMEPRVSVIRQPSFEMGAMATEMLFRRIADPNREYEQTVLRPSLKVRE